MANPDRVIIGEVVAYLGGHMRTGAELTTLDVTAVSVTLSQQRKVGLEET